MVNVNIISLAFTNWHVSLQEYSSTSPFLSNTQAANLNKTTVAVVMLQICVRKHLAQMLLLLSVVTNILTKL